MPDYLQLANTTDPTTLFDNALDQVNTQLANNGFDPWGPSDANLLVIALGIGSQWAADIANQVSTMSDAWGRKFGTTLLGIPYAQGATALLNTTWTFTSPAPSGGYQILAGWAVIVDGQTFYVQSEVDAAESATSATVLLVASQNGTIYSGLGASCTPNDEIDWLASITAIGTSLGGEDQQTDASYQDDLTQTTPTLGPHVVVPADFVAMVTGDLAPIGTLAVAGTAVQAAAATSIDGFDPSVTTFTGTTSTSAGSPAGTTLSAVSSFAGISAGSILAGTAIPANTTVVSVNTGAGTLVMSAAATGNHSSESITSTGSYGNRRTETVFVKDSTGGPLDSDDVTALQEWLTTLREANFVVYVETPTAMTLYAATPIYVTFEVACLPGVVKDQVVSNCLSALLSVLNPATGPNPGGSSTGSNGWLNASQGYNMVRRNALIGAIENVQGVQYVSTLTLDFTASPAGTDDLVLVGPAPLVTSDTSTPTLIGSAL